MLSRSIKIQIFDCTVFFRIHEQEITKTILLLLLRLLKSIGNMFKLQTKIRFCSTRIRNTIYYYRIVEN